MFVLYRVDDTTETATLASCEVWRAFATLDEAECALYGTHNPLAYFVREIHLPFLVTQ